VRGLEAARVFDPHLWRGKKELKEREMKDRRAGGLLGVGDKENRGAT